MKRSRWSAYEITIGALFVALMAIGANITSFVPFLMILGVPLTLQTFFAVLSGLILGSRLGFFSMLVYMVLGLIGTPIFAGFSGGPAVLFKTSFGFILSYVVLAFIAGKLVESSRKISMYITAALTGVAVNYIIGVTWFYAALNFWAPGDPISYTLAWTSMGPFLIKDVAICILAALFAHRLERTVLHRTQLRQAA